LLYIITPFACLLLAVSTTAHAGLNSRLRRHVASLADAGGYRSRAVFTEGNRRGVEFVLRQMRCDTRMVYADTFMVQRSGKMPQSPLVNAVAVLPGQTDSLIIICAHIDATADHDRGWRGNWQSMAAPGAVDNATGVAALLGVLGLAAHALHKPRYTLMFIACNAEERSLGYRNSRDHHLGSRYAAEKLKREGRRVKGVIAMDMVGYNPREQYVGLFASGRSQWLARDLYRLRELLQLRVTLPAYFESCPRSDNDSFDRAGFPAILLMESAKPWTASPHHPRNTTYHSSRDLPGVVNYAILGQVTRLVAAYVMKG
jgi:Zn-dependent M28 family amino/carboxypeptidase